MSPCKPDPRLHADFPIVNETFLPTKLLREVVAFAQPNVPPVPVIFLPLRTFIGAPSWSWQADTEWGEKYVSNPFADAHWEGHAYLDKVIIRIPANPHATAGNPFRYAVPYPMGGIKNSNSYQGDVVYDYLEGLVTIVAHELRHVFQIHQKTPRYYGCKHNRFAERDADCYALSTLRRWRREGDRQLLNHMFNSSVTVMPLPRYLQAKEALRKVVAANSA
jgi:hypothetical protein